MVISLRNKKGDVTIATVILIVLGLAVLVMMIIGFTKGWSFFFDWFDRGPSELQSVAEACALYAQGSLTIDFCSYRLVGDEIVNCQDNRIIKVLDEKGIKYSTIACSRTSSNLYAICESLSASKRDTVRVNNAPNGCGAESVARCDGTVVSCDKITSEAGCVAQNGCVWGNDKCSGNVKICSSFGDEANCEKQKDCVWK